MRTVAMFLIETDAVYLFQKALGVAAVLFLVIWMISARTRRRFLDFTTRLSDQEKSRLVFFALAAVSCWIILLPVLRHWAFQSHTFELGILTNVSWNFLQGKGFYDPVIHVQNYLGDHWQPVLALMAPVLWVWPNAAALVIIQSLGLAAGGMIIYRLAQEVLGCRSWALLAAGMYFLSVPLHAINRFDFHPEFLAVPLIIVGYWAADRKAWAKAFVCFAALWLVKEDMAIVAAAIGLQFFLAPKTSRRFGLLLMSLSVVVFGGVVFGLMPALLGHATPTHMARYANLGSSWSEILRTIFLRPHVVFFGMVGDQAFWEGLKNMVLPFLGLPLVSPPAFWAAIGLAWLPHALSSYAPQRELAGQYAAAFLPMLIVASIYALDRFFKAKNGLLKTLSVRLRQITAWPLLAVVIVQWAFTVSRYFRAIDLRRYNALGEIVRLVPEDTAVSAQSDIGPHLALRQELTQFPDIGLAEFVVLDQNGNKWPLSSEDYGRRISEFEGSGSYELVASNEGVRLYQRVGDFGQ